MTVTAVLPQTEARPRPRPIPEAPIVGALVVRRIAPRAMVGALTITALGIRLVIVRGFWLDEATSGYDARLSYSGMIHHLLYDNHPPLEYTILWLVAHSLGSSQTDLRLPSILFGTLTIPMLYLAGRALYHERAGVLAAAFGTVGALSVWYSQEARMYALFMFLATVTIWALARILATGRGRYWVAWGVAGAAMIWTQWFASLAVGTEAIVIFCILVRQRYGRGQLVRLGVATAAIAVSCAPLLPLLLTQFHNNQANGLGFGGPAPSAAFSPYGILNNLVWALFGYHSDAVIGALVAVWPLGLLVTLLVLGRSNSLSN
jgi:4-amino-4-deoxy-L-arabinose transferase-like glycosyltransferase